VRFVLGTTIRRLVRSGGEVTHVETSDGEIDAHAFVLALGSQTRWLARPLGIRLPVYPLKGYSLTLPVRGGGISPRISITDFKRKVVYAPLANGDAGSLRVAGMADIAGYSMRADPKRVSQLVAEARAAFPNATDFTAPTGSMQPWTGLRPATPKGSPLLGRTPTPNLFVNCGQGALGWTLALASGRVVADTVAGRPSEVPLEQMTLAL
jgi:D-amino-acid dehydrogenase